MFALRLIIKNNIKHHVLPDINITTTRLWSGDYKKLPDERRWRGGSSLDVLSGIRKRAGLSTGGSTVMMSSSHSMPLCDWWFNTVCVQYPTIARARAEYG